MIRYLKQSEIDYHKWDECISKSINCMIYAHSWYLDIVAVRWDALVEDDYKSVMPLPFKRKIGVYKLYQPFFAQQLGVFSKDIIAEDKVNEFFNSIPRKFLFTDINLNWLNNITSKNYFIENRRTYLLDLIEPYEVIKNMFSKNNLRNIKKANKSGLFIQEDGSHEEIIDAFRNNKGKLFPEISDGHYKTLNHLVFDLINRGMAKIIKAYDEKNTFCAGAIFFIYNKRIVFVFSGANEMAKENNAMFGIIDYIIRKFQEIDMTLDFEGSMDENLARFYSGFGSKECLYLRVKKSVFKI